MAAREVGFIGLGAIGGPMAERLLTMGHHLVVHDVREEAVAPLVAQGAKRAGSPAEVASIAEIVFTSLPTPEACRDVAFGRHGMVDGTKIRLHVETSTSGASTIEAIAGKLEERGIGMLDAPVSGGAPGARAGRLTFMVSGSTAALQQAGPALEALAGKLFHVGEKPGLAQVVKIANQLVNATNLAVACEALSMTVRAGLDPALVLDIINASSGRNSATEGPMRDDVLTGRFAGGCRLAIMHKDICLAVAEADRLETSSLVGAAVRQAWAHAAADDADQDFTNLYRYVEAWTGVDAPMASPAKAASRRR